MPCSLRYVNQLSSFVASNAEATIAQLQLKKNIVIFMLSWRVECYMGVILWRYIYFGSSVSKKWLVYYSYIVLLFNEVTIIYIQVYTIIS